MESFVVIEEEISGTQNLTIGPLPASKKPYDVHEAKIVQVANGKVVKRTVYGNTLEPLAQLGASLR